MPPPNPKPLNIPAHIPFWINSDLFSSKKSIRSNSSSPSVMVGAVHSSRLFLLNLQNQKAITKMAISSTQYPNEQPVSPITLGNLSEPLINASSTYTPTNIPICQNILTLISSSKGLMRVSLIRSLFLQFSRCISSYSVSLRCVQQYRWQILGKEQVATPMMMVTMTTLGSHLLRSTPISEPMNMSGSVTKAYWYRIMGQLLNAVCIWLTIFPKDEPRILAKTAIVAFFGSMLKQRIMTTMLGPPPPKPARLERPDIRPISKHPIVD